MYKQLLVSSSSLASSYLARKHGMSTTSKGRSSSTSRFYLANTHVAKGFHLPGITDDARHALAECLQDNHDHHHVYFNDKAGYHNHLAHHLLAAFSLGASADRIRTIHAHQSRIQLQLKPAHRQPDGAFEVDEHWGDDNYYHDYLDFFTKEVEERDGGDGRRTLERWLFEEELGKRNQIYARFFGGAYHALIHLGYGLEYNLNCMIAEGLAQAAIHSPMVASLMADGDENAAGSRSIMDVVSAVAGDKALEGKVKPEDELKMNALMSNGGGPIVRAHVAEWACPADKVYEKAHELQQLAVAAMAGAARPEKRIKFDFFLMHAVTSSIFLPTFVRSLSAEHAARLLRDKLAVDLGYFVSRGRPELNLDQLLSYKSRQPELEGHENAWLGIWDAVLDHTKYQDEHIIKTVRALSYADQHHHDIGLLKQETYVNVARMVLDHVESVDDWDFDGVGFEAVWKAWPDRSARP